MKWFDQLLNRYEKRVLFIFAIFLVIVFSLACSNFNLGKNLLGFSNITDFYRLLENESLTGTFFVTVIRYLLDVRLSIYNIIRFFIEVIDIRVYIMLFCVVLMMTAEKTVVFIQWIKQVVLVYLSTTALMYSASFLLVLLSLQSMDANAVARNMNTIGLIFLIVSVVHIVLFLAGFIIIIYEYVNGSGK